MFRVPVTLVREADDPDSTLAFVDGAIGDEPVRFLVDRPSM